MYTYVDQGDYGVVGGHSPKTDDQTYPMKTVAISMSLGRDRTERSTSIPTTTLLLEAVFPVTSNGQLAVAAGGGEFLLPCSLVRYHEVFPALGQCTSTTGTSDEVLDTAFSRCMASTYTHGSSPGSHCSPVPAWPRWHVVSPT